MKFPDTNLSESLLKALHILTRDLKLNADSNRKLKQVRHLSQLVEPLIKKIQTKYSQVCIYDIGAGKSYFGFILYDLVLRNLTESSLVAIKVRPELVERSKAIASEANFERISFLQARAEDVDPATLEKKCDLVCTLHACDTATDDAILFGLNADAKAFALVPCCQAEVARELEKLPRHSSALQGLYEFPIQRREFGSHLTNVLRCLFLKSQGFKVTVTELVGWEHSLKNELILAERISSPEHPESLKAKAEIAELLALFPIKMRLFDKPVA